MTPQEKVLELRNILREALTPLIDGDYVLLDVPYYENLGDTLIWEGTLQFLKSIPYKCLLQTDLFGWDETKFSEETIILFQGGGNFGDIWIRHLDFRRKVIENHPRNKVIILPQTVHYNNEEILKSDASFYAKFSNITICTRDRVSYNIIKEHFNNRVLLLPDMAFFTDIKKYKNGEQNKDALYIKRNDIELLSDELPSFLPKNVDILDWPNPCNSKQHYIYRKVLGICKRIKIPRRVESKIKDMYWKIILRQHYLRTAIDFLYPYGKIYSTRLHVSILSMMLGRETKMIDNSYGKNSSFYSAWFYDVDSVEYLENR